MLPRGSLHEKARVHLAYGRRRSDTNQLAASLSRTTSEGFGPNWYATARLAVERL